MDKTKIYIIIGLIVLAGGFYMGNRYVAERLGKLSEPINIDTNTPATAVHGYKDATYRIDAQPITLKDGIAETEAAPGSASKIVTKYFGNDLVTDLNGDGKDDVVFLLTQETGGSGVFYYLVAALKTADGYQGSEAMLIGDRIAPQTIEKGAAGLIVVNYADRAAGEDFSKQPSVGQSAAFQFDPTTMQFSHGTSASVEGINPHPTPIVVKDFEGEADPSRMTLTMKSWVWISTQLPDRSTIVPKKPGVFVLTFDGKGGVSVKTDCNAMGGNYTAKGDTLVFSQMMQTEMYCEGSQEGDFSTMLANTSGYHFTSKGELILDLKYDSGSVIFR